MNLILQLEKKLFWKEQVGVLSEVNLKMKNKILITKWEQLKQKNPDLTFFINLNDTTCKKEFRCYAFVPLTAVDVERSFVERSFIYQYITINFNKDKFFLNLKYFNRN